MLMRGFLLLLKVSTMLYLMPRYHILTISVFIKELEDAQSNQDPILLLVQPNNDEAPPALEVARLLPSEQSPIPLAKILVDQLVQPYRCKEHYLITENQHPPAPLTAFVKTVCLSVMIAEPCPDVLRSLVIS